METYKAKIRARVNILSLLAIGTALIYLGFLLLRGQLPELPSLIKGFQIGAFIGGEICVVYFLSKYVRAMRNEANLKQLYIEETDERTSLILQKAGSLGMSIVMSGLVLATLIAGFFSSAVFYALMGASFFVIIVFYSLWAYYAKKL